jgi:hypothetical protein
MARRVTYLHRSVMVQCSTPTYCLCSEDHFVYKYLYQTGELHGLFQIPCSIPTPLGKTKDLILRHKLFRFFRRNIGISNVIELPTGTVLAIYDKVYRYVPSRNSSIAQAGVSFDQFHFFPPLKNGVGVNPDDGCAYCGEYQNARPYAVKIMRVRNDGQEADICYTFPEGAIKHVHSITWDPFRKRFWIATGDNNSEAGLYYTDDDFQTVSYFNGGSQAWRMVSLLPTEQALYWGSDAGKDAAEHDLNAIFRWDFAKNCLEKICDIGNPAYYSAFLENGGMVFSTTYEPGMKQPTDYEAALWYSLQGERWEKIYTLPYKNLQKTQRTQYATINLPKGRVPSEIIPFTPLNTQQWDFDLVALQL